MLCLALAGGVAGTAIYVTSSADAADGYDSIDALADAARIANDQAPDPCPTGSGQPAAGNGTATPQHRHPYPSATATAKPTGKPSASASASASGSAAPSDSATPSDPPSDPPTADPSQSAPAPTPSASTPPDCSHNDPPPTADDYVDIKTVPVNPNAGGFPAGRGASKGTFTSRCGTNRNNHRNSANFIVAPGNSNGAHHTHEYFGNLSTDGNSTDQSLAAARTTCQFGDKSTYYVPAIRKLGTQAGDATAPGGGADGNVGIILRPVAVTLQFRGNARSSVVAMPEFLRIITGDAKAVTNGPTNARAQWGCVGFPGQTTTKYPLCPNGRGVQRILDYPSCWDGKNTDSANHRAHIVFPLSSGRCPKNTTAVPQLRATITYNVPAGRSFALDTFPEQKHSPITDHADFENLMPDRLMGFAVSCINRGRNC
jgi:hypothetical protein